MYKTVAPSNKADVIYAHLGCLVGLFDAGESVNLYDHRLDKIMLDTLQFVGLGGAGLAAPGGRQLRA